jgi:hypothetical protein
VNYEAPHGGYQETFLQDQVCRRKQLVMFDFLYRLIIEGIDEKSHKARRNGFVQNLFFLF